MTVFLNSKDLIFPSPKYCDEHGVVAMGGDASPERLIAAYKVGIFPWPHQGLPLLWFCPAQRFVLRPEDIRINRSLKKAILACELEIKADVNFLEVITNCCTTRLKQEGTWITKELIEGYSSLFARGYAHSIEAYKKGTLVGGLYGVSMGSIFFGESMFSIDSYASRICLVSLAAHLTLWGFTLIDCQVQTDHLAMMGAKHIERDDFLRLVAHSHSKPTRFGPWRLSLSLKEALTLCKPD